MTPANAVAAASPPLTYLPAYLGLFASLLLAMTCNAFLDIHYGTFGIEVLLWGVVFGLTLGVAWRQRGRIGESGRKGQKIMLILGILLSLIIFIPTWGFPRAGLAMLAMLQAAQNCVTVSRRQLHLGLLVSAVMVMFAATHFRADWTMLFYWLPYVTAMVFTLVTEQVSRRVEGIQAQSLSGSVIGGQGTAIAAATTVILLLGLFLYAVTPQLTWPYLQWRYGQLSSLGWVGQGEEREQGRQAGGEGSGQGGDSSPAEGSESQSGQAQGGGQAGYGAGRDHELSPGRGWPTPGQMREAAKRQGMPEWQKDMINTMADGAEWLGMTMQPMMRSLKALGQAFKDWLKQHRGGILLAMLVFAILAMLYALWQLLKEIKLATWLLTRLDYLRLGILGLHLPGEAGGRQFYRAMERLFALHDAQRAPCSNAREYLGQLSFEHGHLHQETAELTRLFEDVRYGMASDRVRISRMKDLYRRLYRRI